MPTPTGSAGSSSSADTFVNDLAAKGVTATAEQLDSIRASVAARSTGVWGTKGDLSPDQTLADDFSRYRLRFTPAYTSIKTYKADAVALANGTSGAYFVDAQFYQRYALPLVVKWDSSARRFIVVTGDGAVSTYTAVNSLAPARYIPIPTDL